MPRTEGGRAPLRGSLQVRRAEDHLLPGGMDEYNYDRLAFSLTAGGHFFPGVIYSQPGYPSFVCLVYLIAGRSLDLI